MKTVVIVVIMVALLITAGVMGYNMLYTQAEDIKTIIDELEVSIESENWVLALKQYTSIDKKWSKIRDIWSMLIDHTEIDYINIDLAELNSFVKSKEKNDALSKLYSLRILFSHIPDKESFTLKNIL